MLHPIWNRSTQSAEPLFFVQSEGQPHAMARLLLVPQSTPKLTHSSGDFAYEPGLDFTWAPGSREIVLTSPSRIPFRTHDELLPTPGSPNAIDGQRDGNRHLLYAEGHFFHDQQVVAEYSSTEPWTGPRLAADATGLSRTLQRLRRQEPLKIVLLGDSISTGANASGPKGAPPHQPAWQDLMVANLRARFGGAISLANLAVGGMCAPWGVEQMPAAIAAAPDLFIIAFGMNDASARRPAVEFCDCVRRMSAAMQAAHPACDVIAVATMTANPVWKFAAPELYTAYLAGLNALRGPGFAVADVTTPWSWIVTRKSYYDLTGNGVNHPNDFGHRLYAEVILALLN